MEEGTTAVVSTPAAPVSAPSSATTSTPLSAREALEQADSSSATPDPSVSATDASPAAAISQPADATAGPESASTSPPAWRWQDILENTRKKTAEEAEARVRQEYAWANDLQGLDPQERAGLLTWRAALQGDPRAIAAVRANPQALAAMQGFTQPAAAAVEPEPDLQSSDGTLVYSAPQLKAWQQWNEQKVMSALETRLQPMQEVAQTFRQEQQVAAYSSSVASVIAEMKAADPAFAEHSKAVFDVIQRDPDLLRIAVGDGETRANPKLAIRAAWGEVYRSTVVPSQQKTAEGTMLAHLQQRAVAGTLNPATAVPTTPKSTIGDARAALLAAGVE